VPQIAQAKILCRYYKRAKTQVVEAVRYCVVGFQRNAFENARLALTFGQVYYRV